MPCAHRRIAARTVVARARMLEACCQRCVRLRANTPGGPLTSAQAWIARSAKGSPRRKMLPLSRHQRKRPAAVLPQGARRVFSSGLHSSCSTTRASWSPMKATMRCKTDFRVMLAVLGIVTAVCVGGCAPPPGMMVSPHCIGPFSAAPLTAPVQRAIIHAVRHSGRLLSAARERAPTQ